MNPSFIVTEVSKVVKKQENAYTGWSEEKEMWRVKAVEGMNPSNDMQLFFETEAQASVFSQWQLYTPAEMVQRLKPFGNFTVRDIDGKSRFFKTNLYTGRPDFAQMSRVSMEGDFGAFWDWYFMGYEAEKFAIGRAYDPSAFFEILPATSSQALAILRRAALEKQAALMQQREGDAEYWAAVDAGKIPIWWQIVQSGNGQLSKDWIINGVFRQAGWILNYIPGDPNYRDFEEGDFGPSPEGPEYTRTWQYFARINMNP